jgi:hypothetical protein
MSTPRRLLWSLAALLAPVVAHAGELDGSAESMEDQHEVAVEADYSFLRKPADVEHLVELGRLVPVSGNAEYSLSDVSFPFARPEVRAFVESLAADYHDEFGYKLVVTSLTRPLVLQPANAHELSVHPAGMAVDLRVPASGTRKAWLEQRLLGLEDAGAIDVTREHHPSHYHVAVFGTEYLPIAAQEASARTARRVQEQLDHIADAARRIAFPSQSALAAQFIGIGGLLILLLGAPLAAYRFRLAHRSADGPRAPAPADGGWPNGVR